MKTVKIEQSEELLNKGLLPDADYKDLNSFLNTISPEDLGEMVNLCESTEEDKLEFLSYIIALIFMYEYDVDECSDIDFDNLFPQFKRQCVAEVCGRLGVWDTSKEDRRFIPTVEPLEPIA